ncbi:MAG TPA: V-type ATP synthase subunit D [Clostridiales bacterium]|jgi:V/A-type H+-transporting ATPase subunit D|nr:V-type ATP synthase subunit D [Clostridiales bacterium]HCS09896.1 V-type ATP synthase subunit D [Clostridiales bacterium]
MAVMVAPTKSNLIKAKSSLVLSKKGYEFLDKKRNILIKEMMVIVEKAKSMHNDIYNILAEAYEKLKKANLTLGVKNVEDISQGVPDDEYYEILLKSVMGVDIPTIKYKEDNLVPAYGFYSSNAYLDEARQMFKEVKSKIYELAEVENSAFKLAIEIEKTQKRTNALQYVQIPKYKEQVKYIQEVLEEKEREDFFRLKRLKSKK